MSTALNDIAAERARQINAEGWTPAHDDEHGTGEMALAAACYAAPFALFREEHYALDVQGGARERKTFARFDRVWPWSHRWWKPKDRRRDLVRAGALIVAEIERLDRASARAALSKAGGE